MIKGKVKVNLDFPNIKVGPQLENIAEKIIIPDIQGRMNTQVDLNGRTYESLDPKTIKRKQKLGLRTDVLLATGQLRKSFKFTKKGKNSVVITPAGTRKSHFGERVITNQHLADILQNQGVESKRGKRHFEFFGISDKAEGKSVAFLRDYIKKAIKRGGRRTV